MEGELNGKVAIITGANSGIGAATARLFADHGCSIILVGRNKERLDSVTKECAQKNPTGKMIAIQADLMKDAEISKIIDQAEISFGKLDILVNNAGIPGRYDMSNHEELMKNFDDVFATNSRSVFCLTQLAVPLLAKTKGNVVNVSSIAGVANVGNKIQLYSYSKAALDKMTKQMSSAFAPKGIRVNSVNPGCIETPLRKLLNIPPEVVRKNMEGLHPFKRDGTSEEIARAILFLASDDAKCITGVLHSLDTGGYLKPGKEITD